MEDTKVKTEFEVRSINEHVRAFEQDGKKYIEGYASVFNVRSKFIKDWYGGYYEIIAPGAFDEVLKDTNIDVIHTPNHDYDKVVSRTIPGTLKLSVDEKGLKYISEIDPTTSYAIDLYNSVKRGDIFESSFTFRVDDSGQTWSEDENGIDIRTITKVMSLREVASVTWGAYAGTDVEARGRKEYVESKTKPTEQIPLDVYKRKLHLKKLQS